MGNIIFGRKVFNWKIQRFSSLVKLGAVHHGHRSGSFKAGGYEWRIRMDTAKTDTDGKGFISLYLCLEEASSVPFDVVIKAVYKLRIYGLLHDKHKEKTVTCIFQASNNCCGFDYMIPLDTFKNPLSGFLVNDSCIFGVEFMELHARTSDVFECWSLWNETISHTHTWKIENFAKLQRPYDISRVFVAGNIKWHLRLYPAGFENNKHVSIYLNLDDPSTLVEDGVYVRFSLCVMDQINSKHKKANEGCVFRNNDICWGSGLRKFLSHQELFNPSNGFLVNNACIVEAVVSVVGPVSRQRQ